MIVLVLSTIIVLVIGALQANHVSDNTCDMTHTCDINISIQLESDHDEIMIM